MWQLCPQSFPLEITRCPPPFQKPKQKPQCPEEEEAPLPRVSLKSKEPFPEASSRHPPCFTGQQLVKYSFSKNETVFTGLDELGFTSCTGRGVDTQTRCRAYQPGRRSDCFQGGSDSKFIIMLPGKDSENTDHLYFLALHHAQKSMFFLFKL